LAACLLSIVPLAWGQIYDNGPFVTHPGAAAAGLDASALQTALGMAVYGHAAYGSGAYRVADDFTVPCNQAWVLTDVIVYGYQVNSGTTPSITSANYRIWRGPPNGGGTLLHDLSGANQLTSVTFANCYRTLDTFLAATTRPIMQVVMNGQGIVLPAGSYWIDWQMDGSTALAGARAVPVTVAGSTTTGNAIQFDGVNWVSLIDVGPQGLAFKISGPIAPASCFHLNITQPGGGGTAVTLADDGGTPGHQALNVATLHQGAYPAGWLFGVDIPLIELTGLLSAGVPWVVTLDGSGAFSLTVGVALPFPVTIYYVGIEFSGAQVISIDVAKTVTIS
jgi:hypothetical protein